jgi:hypothetical protein
MLDSRFLVVLQEIYKRLKTCNIPWAITGSFGMALQGMDMDVHDIDLQTDQRGAYEIESRFSAYVVTPVHYRSSERIRSYLGALAIDDIKVEIMGAIQKRIDEHRWEEIVKVEKYRKWVEIEGMQIPVLSLEYEYQAYLKMGRVEKAEMIKDWLQSGDKK